MTFRNLYRIIKNYSLEKKMFKAIERELGVLPSTKTVNLLDTPYGQAIFYNKIQKRQLVTKNRTEIIQSENATYGLGSKVTFRIKPHMVGSVRNVRLKVVLTETGGANTFQTFPSYRLIKNLNISFNGSIGREVVYDDDYLQSAIGFETHNSFIHRKTDWNFSSVAEEDGTFLSTDNVAAGATRTLYIDLNSTLLNEINYRTITGDVTFEFQLLDNVVTAGTGVGAYTDVSLQFDTDGHDAFDERAMSLMSIPHVSPYWGTIIDQQTLTFTSEVPIAINLRAITDSNKIGLLIIRMRATASMADKENMIDLSQCTFDIVNNNSNSILGTQKTGHELTTQALSECSNGYHQQTRFFKEKKIYPIILGESSRVAESITTVTADFGGANFDTSQRLIFTPNSTASGWTTGSYIISVEARVMRATSLVGGKFGGFAM